MHAIILAAGVGARLGDSGTRPKCLLRFAGQSLLERHLRCLRAVGIERATIGVGFEAAQIEAEVDRVGAGGWVDTVYNPDFREGNIITLWHLREVLRRRAPCLLMDADVLYGPEMLQPLIRSRFELAFLLDRGFEPGDEPVKLCARGGELVEFGKTLPPDLEFDVCGESVGFFRLDTGMAERLARCCEAYLAAGRREAFYEDALRDLMLEGPPGDFGYEDVTGLPWIEIDFQSDIQRANDVVLPRLAELAEGGLELPAD